jgi:hypothetical protein
MIENLRRMEMRAGASRRVESTFSSDVKSSIAGVAHSPTQLRPTPNLRVSFHRKHKNLQAADETINILKLKAKISPQRRAREGTVQIIKMVKPRCSPLPRRCATVDFGYECAAGKSGAGSC